MYGKTLGAVNTATGISLLPDTGNNHLLLLVAMTLLTTGIVIFAVSFVLGRRAKNVEAK